MSAPSTTLRRRDGSEIATYPVATVREAVERAVRDGVSLVGADLTDADLTGADLTDADLRSAVLTDADLTGADLTDADLRSAVLTRAYLRGADLRSADLTGAYLRSAVLTGAFGLPTAPAIEAIDAAILEAIEAPGHALDMGDWHTCETTHCRAGWAITLAGEAGAALEAQLGPSAAGALIYAASGSHPVPDWSASDEGALADLRARAARTRTE